MKKAILFRRILCLALALMLLPALLPGRAARAEGKKPGVFQAAMLPEDIVLPDTLPGGYGPDDEGGYYLKLRDADEESDDGKYTSTEGVETVRVERIGGTIPEVETEEFFEFNAGLNYIWIKLRQLRTEGNAVFNLHMESAHYYLDYQYEIRTRPFNEAEDALPYYEMDFVLKPGEGLTEEKVRTVVKEKYPGIKLFRVYNYDPKTKYGDYPNFCISQWTKANASYIRFFQSTIHIVSDEERYGTDEPVTVKNFAELKKAVNESNANHIVVSPSYRHGKAAEDEELELRYGRTITVSPADGQESAVINGGLVVSGEGCLVFDRVDIEAQENVTGLWVKDGAEVEIGSVSGGRSKKGSGGAGACVVDAVLKVDRAQGGDSAAGLGGDGILAIGSAKVEAGEAMGGASEQGFGGAGVIAAGGAQVTVSGRAAGGNGAAAAGQGTLAGQESTVTLQGDAADGEITEAAKKADPETVSSYAALQYAVRSGKTEIVLDSRFAFGESTLTVPLFTLGSEPVRISVPDGKSIKVRDGFFDLRCGKWEISGIELDNAHGYITAVNCDGQTEAAWNGNLAVKNANAVVVSKCAKLVIKGDISHNSRDAVAVGAITGGCCEITGDVTEKGDINAVYNDGSTVRITGSVTKTTGKNNPAVYSGNKGMTVLNGSLSSGGSQAVYTDWGYFVLNGGITGKPKGFALIYNYYGRVVINGDIPGEEPFAGPSFFLNGKAERYPLN